MLQRDVLRKRRHVVVNVSLFGLREAGKLDRLRVVHARRKQWVNVRRRAFVLVAAHQCFFLFARQRRRAFELDAQLAEQCASTEIIVVVHVQFGMRFVVVVAQFDTVDVRRWTVFTVDIRGRVEIVVIVHFGVETLEEQVELF